MRYIKMVQLLNFSNAHIHHLPWGMKRCAAIGHALAMNPKILLMDEPFSALDIQTRRRYNQADTPRKNNFVCNAQHR
ncbi:MAG: ATP-binding cassette domain-containing protein [Candidatus Nitrosopolaris sp.]